ncbi:MAG: TonB family protein [Elusimicrobia bacterium]|nr:TonB family protein [Elusimicrobiota bacterium]
MTATEGRLPLSVSMSLVIHAGALGSWLLLQQVNPKTPLKVISNVDLLIQVHKPAAQPRAAVAPPKLDMMNFLKLALPSVPKSRPLEVKSTETHVRKLADVQKIEDKGRLKKEFNADKLIDAKSNHRLGQLDASKIEPARRTRAIAEAPKLEEVGVRRAAQSRIDMALATEREGRIRALDAGTAPELKTPKRAQALDALPESAPAAKPGKLSKLADMLTSEEPALPTARPMLLGAPGKRLEDTVTAPAKPKATEALGVKKKSVEIEGPLSNRKVVGARVPAFPKWLADKGVQEAVVKIRFNVSPAGDVLPTMRVEFTSGYGALDRLAMDALREWRFEPVSENSGNQWGVITFRFELD